MRPAILSLSLHFSEINYEFLLISVLLCCLSYFSILTSTQNPSVTLSNLFFKLSIFVLYTSTWPFQNHATLVLFSKINLSVPSSAKPSFPTISRNLLIACLSILFPNFFVPPDHYLPILQLMHHRVHDHPQ